MRLREKFSDVGLEGRPTLRNFKLAVKLEPRESLQHQALPSSLYPLRIAESPTYRLSSFASDMDHSRIVVLIFTLINAELLKRQGALEDV
jgi:hypothetical protein